jgi:hypothetical protein
MLYWQIQMFQVDKIDQNQLVDDFQSFENLKYTMVQSYKLTTKSYTSILRLVSNPLCKDLETSMDFEAALLYTKNCINFLDCCEENFVNGKELF